MFALGGGELLLLGIIALVFIGPKKLPELAKGLGKGIREFQKAKNEILNEVDEEWRIQILQLLHLPYRPPTILKFLKRERASKCGLFFILQKL